MLADPASDPISCRAGGSVGLPSPSVPPSPCGRGWHAAPALPGVVTDTGHRPRCYRPDRAEVAAARLTPALGEVGAAARGRLAGPAGVQDTDESHV